jgi:hypothetical protein
MTSPSDKKDPRDQVRPAPQASAEKGEIPDKDLEQVSGGAIAQQPYNKPPPSSK